jgi:hypothetical protein
MENKSSESDWGKKIRDSVWSILGWERHVFDTPRISWECKSETEERAKVWVIGLLGAI